MSNSRNIIFEIPFLRNMFSEEILRIRLRCEGDDFDIIRMTYCPRIAEKMQRIIYS